MKLRVKQRYATIPNSIICAKNLSFKAKGLFAFIQSKPDGWAFSSERIAEECNEGITSVKSGLQELEREGYLIREKYQNHLGHWEIEYILFEKTIKKQEETASESKKPDGGKSAVGNPTNNNNTISIINIKKERENEHALSDNEKTSTPKDTFTHLNTKEEDIDSHYAHLREQTPSVYISFQKQPIYKKIKELPIDIQMRLVRSFDAKCLSEGLHYDARRIYGRLISYCENWIENLKKEKKGGL